MNNLPSAWMWVITLLSPIIASVALKKSWDGRVRQLVAFSLSLAVAVLVMWIDGSLKTVFTSGNWPIIFGAVLGETELAFKQVWEPHLLTTPIEKKATVELKEVLYVQEAVPVILAGPPITPDTGITYTPDKEKPA